MTVIWQCLDLRLASSDSNVTAYCPCHENYAPSGSNDAIMLEFGLDFCSVAR